MSASNNPNNASKHAHLQDFFARLVSKDFDSLAKELPPSPTKSRFSTSSVTSSRSSMSSEESVWPKTPETRRRALSTINNDSAEAVAIAEGHEFTFAQAMHTFESLEEMKKTAAVAIAASQRQFQPLPVGLRPRKMSATSDSETKLEVPRSPKKPRVAIQSNGRDVKDGTYEATGVSDDPFARVTPRKTRGAQEALVRTRKEAIVDEEIGDNLRVGSVISEVLVLNFVREMHERSFYSSERDLDMAGSRPLTMFPSSRPSVPFGETRENIATLRDRPMKRRLCHDESSDL
ncbi:hypothetical protein DAEQUDRAFT_737171 [Daedalea quercina L-15889]|uniref:Uncharacterized protein n=1 Tax=Daedalea quercina L-15889 TaxID=1314783 RepID=A0A165RI09_9APHY|nr:hypothetical protein DAEQUDRAFT_737171 [Daedalea quercina L-15889]